MENSKIQQKEKDIVEKRIERMQRKVEGAPNVEATMEAVKQLRGEKEKQKELLAQQAEQKFKNETFLSHFQTIWARRQFP